MICFDYQMFKKPAARYSGLWMSFHGANEVPTFALALVMDVGVNPIPLKCLDVGQIDNITLASLSGRHPG